MRKQVNMLAFLIEANICLIIHQYNYNYSVDLDFFLDFREEDLEDSVETAQDIEELCICICEQLL